MSYTNSTKCAYLLVYFALLGSCGSPHQDVNANAEMSVASPWENNITLSAAELEKAILRQDYTKYVAKKVGEYAEHSGKAADFDIVKYASAFVMLSYESGDPVANELYTKWPDSESSIVRLKRDAEYSTAFLIGDCGWMDYSVGRILSHFPEREIETRRVGFSNIPVQLNHTAAEYLIDGRWVFYDPTFGIYFTDDSNNILSLKQARYMFPNVVVHKLDNHKGELATHGAPFPFEKFGDLEWSKIQGASLLSEPVPNFYKLSNGNTVANADVLRTYFISELTDPWIENELPQTNLASTSTEGEVAVGVTIAARVNDQARSEQSYLVFDFSVSEPVDLNKYRLEVSISGTKLDSLAIDYNPHAWDFIAYENSLINKSDNSSDTNIAFSTYYGTQGGNLILDAYRNSSGVHIDTISYRVVDISQSGE